MDDSLAPAMMVNIGLSLELNLKLVRCKLEMPISPKNLTPTSRPSLYDLLDNAAQAQLDTLFDKAKREWTAAGSKAIFKADTHN